MSVVLDVWANHKINFASLTEAKEFIESKLENKISHRSRSEKKELKETQFIKEIQYFADFETLSGCFKHHKKIELTNNFAFCHRIIIYPKTICYWGKGFYTRDTRWMELIRKDFSNELYWNAELATEFTNNWSQFRKYCQEMTRKLGGEKIVYIRDNFNMIDNFFCG